MKSRDSKVENVSVFSVKTEFLFYFKGNFSEIEEVLQAVHMKYCITEITK